MKATIKRIKNLSGDTYFKVFKGDNFMSEESFRFTNKESESEAYAKAMALAKNIENNIAEEVIVYETPETGIQEENKN